MEQLFQDLNEVTNRSNELSVHLTLFPQAKEEEIDIDLEQRMLLAQNISSLVHSLRKKHRMKVRQPLSRILLPEVNTTFRRQVEAVSDLIRAEVNVKEIEFVSDEQGILVKNVKPNFRKLGQEYGAEMKDLVKVIQQLTTDQISTLEQTGNLSAELNGREITLTPEDVEIAYDDIPGWSVASAGAVTVALDITLTDELRKEGIARDVVNRIQNLRKDMGLDVQDKIRIFVEETNGLSDQALIENRDYVCQETQADSLKFEQTLTNAVLLDIDEFQVKVKIEF
jgi:isoleucyl-tRNA synthetase